MSIGGDVGSDCAGCLVSTGNMLGAEGAAQIAAGMQSCPNITSLDLGGMTGVCCVLLAGIDDVMQCDEVMRACMCDCTSMYADTVCVTLMYERLW